MDFGFNSRLSAAALLLFILITCAAIASTTVSAPLREEHWIGESWGENNLPPFPARVLTWRDGILTWRSLATSPNANEIRTTPRATHLLLEVPHDEKLAHARWEEITRANNAPTQTLFLRNGDQIRGALQEIDATHMLFHIDGTARPTAILRQRVRGISAIPTARVN